VPWIYTRSGGAWAQSKPGQAFVRDGGSWKRIEQLHVRNAGSWSVVWAMFLGTLRPDSDIETSDWTNTPLYQKLDEVTADDSTTEVNAQFSGNSQQIKDFEVALSNPASTPTAGEVITIRSRFWLELTAFGEVQKDVKTELKEAGTVRKSVSVAANTSGYTTMAAVLSQAEKDSIGDWTNLRVRIEFKVQGDDPLSTSVGHVTWIELEFS
jgi:hypothetical protein